MYGGKMSLIPLSKHNFNSTPATPLQLSSILGVEVTAVGTGTCQENFVDTPPSAPSSRRRAVLDAECAYGCWARAVLSSGFSIVDANTSAVVGPRLEVQTGCGCDNTSPPPDTACTPYTCLNGGRCVPTQTGTRQVLAVVGGTSLLYLWIHYWPHLLHRRVSVTCPVC